MEMWFERRPNRRNQQMEPTRAVWDILVHSGLVMDHCSVSPYSQEALSEGRLVLTAEAFKKLLEVRTARHPHEFLYPDEFLPEELRTYHAV